jgi:hypothetical protein
MFYGFVYLWQVICHFIIIPYIVPSHHVVHELSNLLGRRNRPPLVVVNEWRLPMVRLRLLCDCAYNAHRKDVNHGLQATRRIRPSVD